MRAIEYLGQVYFNQDYEEDSGSADAVVRNFCRRESAGMKSELLHDVETLLATGRNEADLQDLWVNTWNGYYEPATEGMTHEQWFRRVREILLER